MKKTVLFINGHLNPGGIERSLLDLLNNLNYDDYSVDLLLLEEYGSLVRDLPEHVHVYLYSLQNAFGRADRVISNAIKNRELFPIKYRILYFLGRRVNVKALKYLKSSFPKLKKDYDVIIAYRPGICTEIAAYALKAKTKISWWHHGEMNYSGLNRQHLNEAYKQMTYVVTVSKGCKELLLSYFPDIKDKLYVIPNMVPSEDIYKKSKQKELMPNVEKNSLFTIVSVGRLSPEKNMTYCVEVANELNKCNFDFEWFIVGDGTERDKIRIDIQKYGLERKVFLLGSLTNPYVLLGQADLLFHPSKVESQALSVLEAMSLSVPVVLLRSSGTEEYVENNYNAVFAMDDSIKDAKIIMDLLSSETIRDQLILNGKETVKEFSPERIINELNKLIEQ